MMRGRRGIKTLIVGLMTFSLIATMLIATVPGSVSASPTWQVGNKWALAGEKDIGQIWDALGLLNETHISSGPPMNMTVTSQTFHGKITLYALFEVTAVNATDVTIQIKIAANLTITAKAVVNGNFPAPGIYNWSEYTPPVYENRDISVMGQLVAGSSGTITVVMAADTMAIKSYQASVNTYLKGFLAVNNFPNSVYNDADTEYVLSYQSFNTSVDVNALTGMQVTVSPALQVISDTMIVGDVWIADATVTATETLSGSANMGGIPTALGNNYFNAEMAKYGITGFPIDLAKIYNPYPYGMPINNGTIASSGGAMETQVAYLRNTNVDDAVTGTVSAREYGLQSGGSTNVFTFLIDPANGHTLGSTSTIPMGEAQVIFSTHAAAVNATQAKITTIDTQVSERQSYADVTGTGGGGGLALSSDMLMIIGVVVIVLVVAVVAVMLMRRKK
jgi:hypothetical protein